MKRIVTIIPTQQSSHQEVFLRNGVPEICSKFTGEHPCWSVISIKLLHTSAWVFSCKFATYFRNTFSQEHLWVAAAAVHIYLLICICPFLSFLRSQKQESSFRQFGGLVIRSISVSCLQQVVLYFKVMSNSIGFLKGMFLHVIPVRVIVPCKL